MAYYNNSIAVSLLYIITISARILALPSCLNSYKLRHCILHDMNSFVHPSYFIAHHSFMSTSSLHFSMNSLILTRSQVWKSNHGNRRYVSKIENNIFITTLCGGFFCERKQKGVVLVVRAVPLRPRVSSTTLQHGRTFQAPSSPWTLGTGRVVGDPGAQKKAEDRDFCCDPRWQNGCPNLPYFLKECRLYTRKSEACDLILCLLGRWWCVKQRATWAAARAFWGAAWAQTRRTLCWTVDRWV